MSQSSNSSNEFEKVIINFNLSTPTQQHGRSEENSYKLIRHSYTAYKSLLILNFQLLQILYLPPFVTFLVLETEAIKNQSLK